MEIPKPRARPGFLVRILVILVVLAVLAVSLSNVLGNEKWTVRTYSTSSVYSPYSSIAVDSDGRVHVVYCALDDGSLSYVVIEHGAWTTTLVDSGAVRFPSLALDSGSHVHLVYSLGLDPNCTMKYATNIAGGWANVTLDTNLSYHDSHSAIAVDSSDHVHIAYMAHKSIMYVTNSNGSWLATPIIEFPWWNDHSGPITTKIALDSRDRPHITYLYDRTTVGYLSRAEDGTWANATLFNWDLSGDDAPIAIDSSDRVHICYFGSYVPGPSEWGLVYATKNLNEISGNWSFSLVAVENGPGNQLRTNSLAVDTANRVNVIYGLGESLIHAVLEDSSWCNITSMPVEDMFVSSMALDPGGHAYVCLGGNAPTFATESLGLSQRFEEASPGSILLAAGIFVLLGVLVLETVKRIRGNRNLDR